MTMSFEQMTINRDYKLRSIFSDNAPLWLMDDQYHARQDSFLFNVVYFNPVHGWIKQHFKYDVVVDALYNMGETRVSEESLLEIPNQYIFEVQPSHKSASMSIPNNPANRL